MVCLTACANHRVGSHCHTAFLTPRHCTGAARFAAAAVDRHRTLQCPLQYLRSTAGRPRSFFTDFCPKRQGIVQQPVGLQGRYGVSTCCRELSSLAPERREQVHLASLSLRLYCRPLGKLPVTVALSCNESKTYS